jgi:hypothetical protein
VIATIESAAIYRPALLYETSTLDTRSKLAATGTTKGRVIVAARKLAAIGDIMIGETT